eukprot:gene28372-35218_t
MSSNTTPKSGFEELKERALGFAAKIAPGIVILILALQFTTKFPAYVRSKAVASQSAHAQSEIEAKDSRLPLSEKV